MKPFITVSTHSRLKAAGAPMALAGQAWAVSTHSRLKAAGVCAQFQEKAKRIVSTHSRLKAAGDFLHKLEGLDKRFNTQPPEGGWLLLIIFITCCLGFNTQPPEGGWKALGGMSIGYRVSTHSRLKAAA